MNVPVKSLEHKAHPDIERLQQLENEVSRLFQEEQNLQVQDHEKIAKLRRKYGAIIRAGTPGQTGKTMITYFECIDPDRNKKAFYVLSTKPVLFGFMLIMRWGRIGTKGQSLKKYFPDESEMLQEYQRIRKKRLQRRYIEVPDRTTAVCVDGSCFAVLN